MRTTGIVCLCGVALLALQSPAAEAPESARGMIFLRHADPRFLEGLRRHGMLGEHGLRLLNTGWDKRPFGEKWSGSALLEQARAAGVPYYIDRLCGGMPFQSLEGLEAVARTLKDDPNFLGFQIHEWGNSPIHDYHRIHELLGKSGEPFGPATFAPLLGRLDPPHFSGGDYAVYRDVYRPLVAPADVDAYLTAYIKHYIAATGGKVVGVNGYVQLYHKALRLGAANVMPEIGNQVPLTALQIACARGAAREHGKPFGVYYEPWGGNPFGCPCATGWSPWCADTDVLRTDGAVAGFRVGTALGSSRSLQRRLLYYAWLSGASYCAEEWGAENTFANWLDYPLTDYGLIVKEFMETSARVERPRPIVPAAMVMPPGCMGIDVRVISGFEKAICGIVPADEFHRKLGCLATELLAAQPRISHGDAYNLTASPWIGCFDVLSDEAPANLLSRYGLVIYFDAEQAARSPAVRDRVVAYGGEAGEADRIRERLSPLLPYRVAEDVGCVQALAGERCVVGVFNNVGVRKAAGRETADPKAARAATVRGPADGAECLVGRECVTRFAPDRVELRIPAGEFVLLSFPVPARP